MSTDTEDSSVLLQRYIHAHDLYMSYLNRFFDIGAGRAPARSGETLTDDALAELARLYAEEGEAHRAWWGTLPHTRANA